MRTEYEGRETAVRVCSCQFILGMVGYCKVPKVMTLVTLRVLLLWGFADNNGILSLVFEDRYFFVGLRGGK